MERQAGSSFKLDRVSVGGQTEAPPEQSPHPAQSSMHNQRHEKVNNMSQSLPGLSDEALLTALVGSKRIATLTVDGVSCSCLLDSGSQVTTVSESFHRLHLPSQSIKPLRNILDIEGAAGQTVPYLGYIELSIFFPQEITGKPEEMSTLALVVPDCRTNKDIPVLVGTNVLDVLYEIHTGYEETNVNSNHVQCTATPLIKIMYNRQVKPNNDTIGKVKLLSKKCVTVSPGKKVALTGYARNVCISPGTSVLVEPAVPALPGGLMFCSYVMTAPVRSSFKVPILVKNESAHVIRVPASQNIADLCLPLSVSPLPPAAGQDKCKGKAPQPTTTTAMCNKISTPEPASTLKFDFTDSPLCEEWKRRVTERLSSMSDVFATYDLDYGHTTAVKHRIRLSDPTPFKQRPRPVHPSDYEAVRLHLKELYDAKVIRESESPFASPIVIVKKKNGAIRLCIDYRKLNNQTIKDAYALPNIEEAFSALTGSKWFSVMDLKSGYYQVEVEEEDKHKTAFVTPLGFWEFNRMPQGVTNAPSTFQRVMEKCVGSMNLKEVMVFLDDLIVFSATLEEHEERLMRVLNKLKEFGLKLSPEKCSFFRTSVKYLGHIVSERGVETDPGKIAALTTWPKPKNIKELKSFLGFAGYYRRFIRDYSKIARPLNDLTVGYLPPKKSGKGNLKHTPMIDPRKPFADKWTTKCDDAFDTLIEKLTSAPVLGFADAKKPYVLHTDASLHGLGAALYQEQDGQLRVIAFASRGLSNCEKRYPTHKLEFLALKWAVTDKFFDYLYGAQFTIVTDNNPLTYVLTTAKLDAAGHRWLAALSTFDFHVQYRAGKKNQDADGLSRRPHPQDGTDLTDLDENNRIEQFISRFVLEKEEPEVSAEVVKAICQKHLITDTSDIQPESLLVPAAVECLAMDVGAIPPEYSHTDLFPESCTLPRMSHQDWALEQKKDTNISRVISILKAGRRPSYRVRQREDREVQLMLRLWDQLVLRDEVLYRKRKVNGVTSYQLILPQSYRQVALEGLHDATGHMGVDRTMDLVRTRFYWPHMQADVNNKVKKCEQCVRRKARAERSAPLVNIQTSRPLELVCMDYLSLEPDGRGTKNILVITDHFTKYAVAVPTPDQKAKTVAKALWNNFFIHYGFPERLHSDQGRDFESTLIKELCGLLGIKKTRTTPYHPRGNPVERFNRTLLAMLGTLQEEDKVKWRDFVQPLVHSYNCTKHDTTGYSPYQLMFGRQPNLPIDIAFGLCAEGKRKESHIQYVKNLRESLQESYQIAADHSAKSALHNKQRFDQRVRESKLEAGDRVLVRNVGIRGKHKLANRWSQTVYKVIKQVRDLPVYVIAPCDSDGPERVLHRDLLLPCGFLPSTAVESQPESKRPARKAGVSRFNRATDNNNYGDEECEENHIESESDDIDYYYPYFIPVVDRSTTEEDGEVDDLPQSNEATASTDQGDKAIDGGDILVAADDVSSPESIPENGGEVALEESTLDPEAMPFKPPGPEDIPDSIMSEPVAEAVDTQELQELGKTGGEESSPANDGDRLEEADHAENAERRSARERTRPKRLTYPSLGNPLVEVMQSFLRGLDKAFTEALVVDSIPYIRQLQPHVSETV